MTTKQPTCRRRWAAEKNSRFADLRKLWKNEQNGIEDDPDVGNLNEYGLCFDYVAPGTFGDQPEGYFRYQLSWGGPSDEIRYYFARAYGGTVRTVRVEYWFLDWFDGHGRSLVGKDLDLALELLHWHKPNLGETLDAIEEDEEGIY